MTTITDVEYVNAVVPLDKPIAFGRRQVSERHYGLVRVRGDDGVSGIGFCYAGHAGGALVTTAIGELLAPLLIGADPYRVSALWDEMYFETLLHGRAGSVLRAISALDMALWDRNARAAGQPLWKYLGGHSGGTVPAYASGGYYQEGKSTGALAEELAGYVDLGFDAVKMKVGRLSPEGDAERVAAARQAIGPDVRLMVDANNAYPDLLAGAAAARAFEAYDIYFLEEPFLPDNIEEHRLLSERTSIPIATGEIEVGRWRHAELVERGGVKILQTDAAVCGGVTEYRRIAAHAEMSGVIMCPHWFHDLHAQLVAATPNARYVEFFHDDHVFNFRRLITDQITAREGRLTLPETPGVGFDFDEEAVRHHVPSGWQRTTK